MTIREQLEKEMEQEEIKEMEEENADSEKLDKVDNSNSNNDSNTNRDYQNQRALDSRRKHSISILNGYAAVVCAKKSKRIYRVL